MRISELQPGTNASLSDLIAAVSEGVTVSLTLAQIKGILALDAGDIGFRDSNVYDALEALVDGSDVSEAITAINQALAGKLASSAKLSAAEMRAGTEDTKFATAKAITDAMGFVTFTAASINLANLINGKIILSGTTTFAAPTNAKEGQTGVLAITQDGTGGRAGSWNTFWDFGSAGVPTLSSGAGKTDLVTYVIMPGATKAMCSFIAAAS